MNTTLVKATPLCPISRVGDKRFYHELEIPEDTYYRAHRLVRRGYYENTLQYLDRWYDYQKSRLL